MEHTGPFLITLPYLVFSTGGVAWVLGVFKPPQVIRKCEQGRKALLGSSFSPGKEGLCHFPFFLVISFLSPLGRAGSPWLHRLSLVVGVVTHRLVVMVLILLQSVSSRHRSFRELQHASSVVAAPRCWSAGSGIAAPRLSCSEARGSSWTWGRTSVPCIAKWILYR